MDRDFKFDIIVIGGGHAGCEAALAASRMGASVLMVCLYLDSIAMMPCNPSIGGPAKGHLVREMDALGGEMAAAADASTRHLRRLNSSKGPAVMAIRAQCDPRVYGDWYRYAIMNSPNLRLYQAEVSEICTKGGSVTGVKVTTGDTFSAGAVILATGTYLASKIYIGLSSQKSGPIGMVSAGKLARNLRSLGVRTGRLRTDTTPRLKADTVDWDSLDKQESMSEPDCFSHFGEKRTYSGMVCAVTRTNPRTHEIIRRYFGRSPLAQGVLEAKGPRYCPSIDDKIIKFPERDSHPIFLEPINSSGGEVYMQNFSTSMCLEAQIESVRSIRGCERAEILRPGYAIEYDYSDPTQLEPWLEHREIKNLFMAGQVNGTSGYEEAGAQGLIAGMNAALVLSNREPLVLGRDSAYIGVLIDDLVTKGTNEPYRMLTSRCEHRLILRDDNALERLAEIGHGAGLLPDDKYEAARREMAAIEAERERLSSKRVSPTREVNEVLELAGSKRVSDGITYKELLKRPDVKWQTVSALSGSKLPRDMGEKLAVIIKYEGYIVREKRRVEKLRRMEKLRLPEDFPFSETAGLSAEGRQKLIDARPRTVGQASRISGVTPADVQILWTALEKYRRERKDAER
jgi:tRNA uridine 5-carboxymethylaminomethyl modification enzyme